MTQPSPPIAQYVVVSHRVAPNRTEHVNIGIATRRPDGRWQAHMHHDLRKLRAVDPSTSPAALRDWADRLPTLLQGQSMEAGVATLRGLGFMVGSGAAGQFLCPDDAAYLRSTETALRSLVAPPPAGKRKERDPVSRLHLDLKASFDARGWMGKDISAHQIVERHPVGPMVTAEFALQNGVLHVLESIDLRTSNPSAKKAEVRSKVLALDMALSVDPNAKRYTVLAGHDSPMASEAASLAKHYSSQVWQWESASDMDAMLSTLAKATGKPMLPVPVAP